MKLYLDLSKMISAGQIKGKTTIPFPKLHSKKLSLNHLILHINQKDFLQSGVNTTLQMWLRLLSKSFLRFQSFVRSIHLIVVEEELLKETIHQSKPL